MAQHRNKACKAIESGIAGYPGGKNCLSARAAIRGKRATKNIRKCVFPEVLFDLLPSTNRMFNRNSRTPMLVGTLSRMP